MNNEQLEKQLAEISEEIWLIAKDCEGENVLLLSLLRSLENLHREIRSQLFEPSLPNTRHSLYGLLKDIEENGGWPYIERMKLQDCLRKMENIEKNM